MKNSKTQNNIEQKRECLKYLGSFERRKEKWNKEATFGTNGKKVAR